MSQLQIKSRGRVRRGEKSKKRDDVLWVRLTPSVTEGLRKLTGLEGYSYSDSARLLMIEALKARGLYE